MDVTLLIVVPIGFKLFTFLTICHGGLLQLLAPMLFANGFVLMLMLMLMLALVSKVMYFSCA